MNKQHYRPAPFTPRRNILPSLASLVIVIAGIKAAEAILVPFLLAMFLAVICYPVILFLGRRGVPVWIGVLFLVAIMILMEMALANLIGSSFTSFTQNVPHYQQRLKVVYFDIVKWLESRGLEKIDPLTDFDPSSIMPIAATTLKQLGGLVKNTFFVLVTLIFILFEAGGISAKLQAIFFGREKSLGDYATILQGINRFLGIKTITSAATGILVAAWLIILGVDFPLLWGVVAFLLNYIPTIGSIIASIPALLLALVQSGPAEMGICAAGYLVINITISNFIEPRFMGDGVGLSALVVFLSMAFWGWVLGPAGMLLSVPLTMAVKIAAGSHEHTRWLAILLGSNAEAHKVLKKAHAIRKREERRKRAATRGKATGGQPPVS